MEEKENVHGSLISALSNLSIQYNLGVIAPALLLLDPSRSSGGTILPIDAAYPRSDEMDSILKTAVFAGAIFGQFTMGLLADAIGSLPVAMIITNLFALFGSIGCTIAPLISKTDPEKVYWMLAISRAVLGIGVGDPLGSAMRAEIAEQDARKSKHGEPELENHRAMEVAQGFFWQTPGAILPYFISLVLLLILGGERHDGVGKDHLIKTQIQYMILVGSGAIPCFAIIWLQLLGLKRKHSFCSHNATGRCDGEHYAPVRTAKRGFMQIQGRNSFKVALQNRSCWKKLVGT
eukprot:scaffold179428_cov44-Attheya_sp.AAC.1